MDFELWFHGILTCMCSSRLGFKKSTCFCAKHLIWKQGLKVLKPRNYVMCCFQYFKFDFAQLACFWALVLLNGFEFMMFCKFPSDVLSFWPKRTWLMTLNLSFELGSKSENSKILPIHSSYRTYARATTLCFALPLEWPKVGSSVNCMLPKVYKFCRPLERLELRSSEDLNLTLERPPLFLNLRSSEDPVFSKFN